MSNPVLNCKFSLAASGGIFLGKEYHFDIVRPGIALYGGKLFFKKELKLENNEYKIQILDLEDQLHNLKYEKENY